MQTGEVATASPGQVGVNQPRAMHVTPGHTQAALAPSAHARCMMPGLREAAWALPQTAWRAPEVRPGGRWDSAPCRRPPWLGASWVKPQGLTQALASWGPPVAFR